MNKLFLTTSLCLALSLSLALPAQADTKVDRERDHNASAEGDTPVIAAQPGTPMQDPVERFVEANVLETLYHELAHALIEIMNLPVFGPEEFAADFFAAILLDRMHDEATSRQMVLDVSASYQADERMGRAAGQSTPSWSLHGKPMQRYYNLACLYYGADPEGRADMLEVLGLPESRAQSCVEEFEQADYAWGGVLEELSEGAPSDTIVLDWILDEESHLTRFVTQEVAALNRILALPEPITVSVIPCGEVNAYFVPGDREILICTELAEHLQSIAPG